MSNYSALDLPKGLEAYYNAQAWLLSTIYGAVLALFVCLGLFGIIVIVVLICAFEWNRS